MDATSTLKAIETQYKGYRFRSRLEARWAVFFDLIGVQWEYEPEGFDLGPVGYYLPDFRITDIHGSPFYLEIKAIKPKDENADRARITSEEKAKCAALSLHSGAFVWLVCGDPVENVSSCFGKGVEDLKDCQLGFSHGRFLSYPAVKYGRDGVGHLPVHSMPGRTVEITLPNADLAYKSREARFEHGEKGIRA